MSPFPYSWPIQRAGLAMARGSKGQEDVMVYFPETGTPATAETTTVAAVWTERIDSAYREMPGLRLTLAQAARLWGVPAPQCLALLGALVERGRLVETPEGLYCVGDDLRRARRTAGPCAS